MSLQNGSMANKIMWHVDYIIVDQNTKYGEDLALNDETTVRSCIIQEYYQ